MTETKENKQTDRQTDKGEIRRPDMFDYHDAMKHGRLKNSKFITGKDGIHQRNEKLFANSRWHSLVEVGGSDR